MSARAHDGPPPDSPSDVRALPARPNLEFERKQAKKLLAQIRRGNTDALARVHAKLKGSAHRKTEDFRLADAQFTIAREYGFTSWPRLVEYFDTLTRHEHSRQGQQFDRGATPRAMEFAESRARSLLAQHSRKSAWAAETLASFVPRLYGRTPGEVLVTEVTIDDARLATARLNRFPSWEVMKEGLGPYDAWADDHAPLRKAFQAIREEDLGTLERLVEEHPDLLSPVGHPRSDTIARSVLWFDVTTASPGSQRIYQWLKNRVDLSSTLNWMLLGHMRMQTTEVQRLLDRGADPEWLPPNGISVLEHLIYRAWNGEAVDLVAKRVRPRKAFWIAAGSGDVKAVEEYLDPHGVPTPAARLNRPDFTAMGLPLPSNPGADDRMVVWEAFFVACTNSRWAVLDVLLDRGFPIDYEVNGQSMLRLAVGNGLVPLAEYLIRRGADPEARGRHPDQTAREIAEDSFARRRDDPVAQRLRELSGGRDPEVLLQEHAERQARRVMQTAPQIEEAFTFAKLDSLRLGHTAVVPESLFVGLIRGDDDLPREILADAGVDLSRLKDAIGQRLSPADVTVPPDMTGDAETTALLMAARADAEQRTHSVLNSLHLLHAMLQRDSGAVLDLIQGAGGSKERVLAGIERVLGTAT